MEYKTKYNIGDEVYYIGYTTVEKTCECCGNVYDESFPDEVVKGKVLGIMINENYSDTDGNGTMYKLTVDGNWFTHRDEQNVFSTEKEAEIAFRMEVE